MASFQLTEYRHCPECRKLFKAMVTIEVVGDERCRSESPCPDCGTAGKRLIGETPASS
jgi:hypothetical protein